MKAIAAWHNIKFRNQSLALFQIELGYSNLFGFVADCNVDRLSCCRHGTVQSVRTVAEFPFYVIRIASHWWIT